MIDFFIILCYNYNRNSKRGDKMIILYTTHCPKCKILEKKLEKANIQYETCDDASIMNQKGFTSAPMLEVNEKTFNFKEAVDWINKGGNVD